MDKKLLEQLKVRCGGLCELCGSPGDWRGLSPHHKIFKSHQGKDSLDNVVMLCGRCHSDCHGLHERGVNDRTNKTR